MPRVGRGMPVERIGHVGIRLKLLFHDMLTLVYWLQVRCKNNMGLFFGAPRHSLQEHVESVWLAS